MDKKREVLTIFDLASLIAMIVATALVFIFELTGDNAVVQYSIMMYSACFACLVTALSIKTHFIFKKQDDKEKIFVLSTKQKVFHFVFLIISILAFLGTVAVYVLY